ncbi:hypothetical protein CH298_19060 [Rhodococcoides fascians]|uniref:hypothetical protein n=1 Tax=Rhodococcoides fascians TaxID=1828 RepID=UPI000B9AC861|nr:hypothetical protein [Rhodococcus fascians]OZE86493.1 hypothetical protein CH303_19415 [Rhodococcus fascians]OZF13437.1 hypothetical protein CH298_19060 [Rhodococcus fascians]OZF15984.1 hypothetical protein CH297_19440 [Rhodococcus fascians]OZF62653.1 hypothetical protein CH308_19335 [Rhodococcus fascians]OZF66414.1 hypothetical protein CH307_19530 [Rhodococcus fascians]
MYERVLTVPDAVERENLQTFCSRALRLDEAAVVRLRTRAGGGVSCWAATGFDALAARVIAGTIVPDDTSAGADVLVSALQNADDGVIDPGFSMDSAWRGTLPPDSGFEHLDDVPARVLIGLAQRGAALAKEHGSSHGPPSSLLEQQVLHVTGDGDDVSVTMRTVFALTAMGFVPHDGTDPLTIDVDPERIAAAEVVRVRATKVWLRLDARFGSVFVRRPGRQLSLTVER